MRPALYSIALPGRNARDPLNGSCGQVRHRWAIGLMVLMLMAPVAVARALPDMVDTADAMDDAVPGGARQVEIRRTTDGVAHVRAPDWQALGVGIGLAQAQDALCTLAEGFVTYEGRRSWFFGADARPARDSNFGRPRNIELDVFFRAFADDVTIGRLWRQQPAELQALVAGYAQGYNRHLKERHAGGARGKRHACLGAPWVRPITSGDVYRRLYAAQVAAGYLHFIPEIVNARPPASPEAGNGKARDDGERSRQSPSVPDKDSGAHVHAVGTGNLAARLAHRLGTHAALGSNMLALGRQASGEAQAVLLGNPHWYWGGPDRFHQMHLTIPGQLDVAGVGFLGVPLVMIGFNDRVAWSHTVSAARRFGLFELRLDADDPTRYWVDGRLEAMTRQQVRVPVRGRGGRMRWLERTLYRSRFGPLVDMGEQDAQLGWRRTGALALRDVNAENFRIFRNFLRWNRAASLDEFMAIQRAEAAMPWVNTVAIGRGDGRVWYADVGAVPNVSDAWRERCAAPLAERLAQVDPLVPVLDGSRAACNWQDDPAAVLHGTMPAEKMPALLRADYVANMNNSYWLTNVHAPLTGYPKVLGGEGESPSSRTRLGQRLALDLLARPSASVEALSERVRQQALVPTAYGAMMFREALLAGACAQPAGGMAGGRVAQQQVDMGGGGRAVLQQACGTLQRWSGRADVGERGVLLWETLWAQLEEMPEEALYRVPFSSGAPLGTPAGLALDGVTAARVLMAAAETLLAQGVALDEPLGRRRYVRSGGRRLPIYGGCASDEYFVVACGEDDGEVLGPDSLANSYLQVVHFGRQGVEAHTLLAHGQDERALTPAGTVATMAPVVRYARKDWLRFPFREADIARDAGLTRQVLQLPADAGRR